MHVPRVYLAPCACMQVGVHCVEGRQGHVHIHSVGMYMVVHASCMYHACGGCIDVCALYSILKM